MNIYLCKKSNIAVNYDAFKKEIEPTKLQRIYRVRDEEKQKTLILSDHLARYAIAKHCNIKTYEIEFYYNSLGKPFAKGLDVYFSVSHSGDYVVVAVSDKPVGIDIETLREVKANTVKRVCCENEIECINNAHDKNAEFLKIWTKKEAYFKSVGCGIVTNLSLLDTTKENGLYTYLTNDYIVSVYSAETNIERCAINYDKY